MGYQVIRVEKMKGPAQIAKRIGHAMRDHIPNNADPDRENANTYGIYGDMPERWRALSGEDRKEGALKVWKEKLPEKHRKDAVTCLEFIVTGSKEDMAAMSPKKQRDYLVYAGRWIVTRFGGGENFICQALHYDETTPHLSLFMIPKVGGKLNAKKYINGPADLSKLQTDFNNDIAKHFGLNRGRFMSPARHTSIKEFYRVGAERMKEIQLKREEERLKKRSSGMER